MKASTVSKASIKAESPDPGLNGTFELRSFRASLPGFVTKACSRIQILAVFVDVSNNYSFVAFESVKHSVTVVRISVDIRYSRKS